MNRERILYFDVLNVISCFSVVCLHSNGYVHEYDKDVVWGGRVFIEVLCFFAVPMFFMLSGATLMDYRNKYSTKVFIKKRTQKAFLPFLFWSMSFLLLDLLLSIRSGNDLLSIVDVVEDLFTGNIPYTNYWFFIPLFLLYAFLPFLSRIVESQDSKQLLSLCVLLIIFQFIIPTIFKLIGINVQYNLPIGGYFVYALIGYYLSKTSYEYNNKVLFTAIVLSIIFLIIRFFLIYCPEQKSPIAFSYFGLYALFPSATLFILVKKYYQGNMNNKYYSFLAKKSYGVFLIHTFLISNLTRVVEHKSIFFIPISIIVAYFGSVLIVHLMQKNSVLKHIVP